MAKGKAGKRPDPDYRLDPDLPEPPHAQVAESLRTRIKDGELTGRLPTLDALSGQYGVSAMTVQKAIRTLKDEGLVTGRPGLGMFVVRQ